MSEQIDLERHQIIGSYGRRKVGAHFANVALLEVRQWQQLARPERQRRMFMSPALR
jgi:hypothetical protein